MAQTLDIVLDPANARAALTLTWTDPTPVTVATIQRVNVSTGEVGAVRDAEPATTTAGVWTGYDYETPLDEPFFYIVTSTDQPAASIISATVTLDSAGRTWLKHPGRPVLNTPVEVASAPNLTRPITQGVFDVLGRARPVAVAMQRNSERGELALTTVTDADRSAIAALIDDGTPLLFQSPAGYGLGNIYISVSDVKEDRLSPYGPTTDRRWTLPFIRVDRPAGSALPPPSSWQAVVDAHTSWMDVLLHETSWQDVLDGVG